MEVVKAFNANELHTEIIIKGTFEEPLFRANDIATILEISNIRCTIQYFDETEKVVGNSDTLGGNQQVAFLTEKGLYKVLFRSRKPIAEKFQNWVCEVIKEIRLNGQYKLNDEIKELQATLESQKTEFQQLEDKKKHEYESELSKQLATQKVLEREKVLLSEYATIGSIVYIIRVKSIENSGQYIVKIGESRKGIRARYAEHKNKYEECLLLDCFAVDKSKDFESFIHNHENIRPSKVNNLAGHENEMELFLVGKHLSYQTVLNIVNNNIKYFSGGDTYKTLEQEVEKLRLLLEMKSTNNDNVLIDELVKEVKQMSKKVDALEKSNRELLDKYASSSQPQQQQQQPQQQPIAKAKSATGFGEPLATVGPRLQKLNPETLELVKVYETATEAMKESHAIKRPSLNNAIIKNMVYCGFRWMFVDRELDATTVHDNVPPTKQTKSQNLGYIAQLDAEKTKITNVYLDRKTAAQMNGYESSAALDTPVKQFTITKGFFYRLYDECEDDLRVKFETEHEPPLLYKKGIGQFDAITGQLVQQFACKYDCIRKLQMSDKTLAKTLTKNVAYNGHHYKEIGARTVFLSA